MRPRVVPAERARPAADHERPAGGEVLDGEEDLRVYQPDGVVPADDVVGEHDRGVRGDQVESPLRSLSCRKQLNI